MKRILLLLLCLMTISVFAGTKFASGDVDQIANNDSIQIYDDTTADVSISENADSQDNINPSEVVFTESNTDAPTEICRPIGIEPTPEDNNNNDSTDICRPVGIEPTPVGVATNITEKPTPEDDGGNEIVGRADLSKEPVILKKSEPFTLNGTEMFLSAIDNGTGPKLVCYKSSSGMNGATSTCFGEAGTDLVNLLHEEGVFKDMGYVIKMFAIDICDYFDWDWPFGDFFG